MIVAASTIIIVGGIKTLASGGGYGELNLMVTNNSGLYEGSTISAVAIAIIPIILWFPRFGTIFPPDWRVKTFRSEEHTSELQSLLRISYAVFCLKKKKRI